MNIPKIFFLTLSTLILISCQSSTKRDLANFQTEVPELGSATPEYTVINAEAWEWRGPGNVARVGGKWIMPFRLSKETDQTYYARSNTYVQCIIYKGKLKCRGLDLYGHTAIPTGLRYVTRAAILPYNLCVQDIDELKCWGPGTIASQLPQKIQEMSGGIRGGFINRVPGLLCVISDRKVHCAHSAINIDSTSQSDSSLLERLKKLQPALRNPRQLQVIGHRTVCVTDDGSLKCWGGVNFSHKIRESNNYEYVGSQTEHGDLIEICLRDGTNLTCNVGFELSLYDTGTVRDSSVSALEAGGAHEFQNGRFGSWDWDQAHSSIYLYDNVPLHSEFQKRDPHGSYATYRATVRNPYLPNGVKISRVVSLNGSNNCAIAEDGVYCWRIGVFNVYFYLNLKDEMQSGSVGHGRGDIAIAGLIKSLRTQTFKERASPSSLFKKYFQFYEGAQNIYRINSTEDRWKDIEDRMKYFARDCFWIDNKFKCSNGIGFPATEQPSFKSRPKDIFSMETSYCVLDFQDKLSCKGNVRVINAVDKNDFYKKPEPVDVRLVSFPDLELEKIKMVPTGVQLNDAVESHFIGGTCSDLSDAINLLYSDAGKVYETAISCAFKGYQLALGCSPSFSPCASRNLRERLKEIERRASQCKKAESYEQHHATIKSLIDETYSSERQYDPGMGIFPMCD
jgi:hypothetical protein